MDGAGEDEACDGSWVGLQDVGCGIMSGAGAAGIFLWLWMV